MGKQLAGFFLLCVLVSAGLSVRNVSAATIKAPYMAEQAEGKAPEVTVYMTGSKMSRSVSVSGKIGNKAFVQEKRTVSFGKSGEGICYIILLDNSGSVNQKQFAEARKQIAGLRQSLSKRDRMVLYTVGTYSAAGSKKNVLGRVAKGSEKTRKKSDVKKINKIKYLASSKSKTVLYRSLNEVLAEQASPRMRTVVLMITDGEDDSRGKDIDKVSTSGEVKNALVPVYGILLHNDSSHPNKAKIHYTKNQILAEKNCRGFYYDCSVGTSPKSVKKAFHTISRLWRQDSYVVRLRTQTNQAAGREKLHLTANHSAIRAVAIDYSDYKKDENAPAVVGSVGKSGENSIHFSFHDEYGVNVSDLQEASHYMVQTKERDDNGKIWSIESVSTELDGDEFKVTLTFTERLYNGEYVLKCSGIRDNSQDQNEVNASYEFVVEDGLDAGAVARKEFLKSYWWIGLIFVVAVIGIILLILIRKRAVKVVEIDPDELHKADTKQIRLTITDRSGAIKDVEWNVEGSLFVGRSDICNIFFDDDRLSKQHFVIEATKMGCYIEDLESTNGTFVNGVKMANRRMLLDGDVITAGREKMVFHMPNNQPDLESI